METCLPSIALKKYEYKISLIKEVLYDSIQICIKNLNPRQKFLWTLVLFRQFIHKYPVPNGARSIFPRWWVALLVFRKAVE